MSQGLSLSLVCTQMHSQVPKLCTEMILCESVLGSTDTIRSVPIKVQSSVPNPTDVASYIIVLYPSEIKRILHIVISKS